MKFQIVVLAGGLGTRLGSITQKIPKALVPIHGIPFIDYQLKWLAKSGIQEVILSTGYLSGMIQDYVQTGKKWGLEVTYVDEGSQLRGTGGALRLIYDQGLLQERFLVTYGDSFLPISFKNVWEYFQRCSEPALMTVLKNHGKWDSSNVCFQDRKVTLYDKKARDPKPAQMEYIDYGLTAFQKNIIPRFFKSGEKADLADLFHQLSLEGLLAGYEVQERFYEIGSFQGIVDLETYLNSSTYIATNT